MRKARSQADKPDAVAALEWQIRNLPKEKLPWPVREYRFHPTKRYAFDLCWPQPLLKIGVEIDGGIWRPGGGAHTGTGHIRDIRKGNDAILCGYKVLHFIPEDIVTRSGRTITEALDVIVELFKRLGYKET